jgi:aspartyl-tRNA(Asn)/glutamyl-tRNA(Gln) amidotransferase subunit C
MPVEIDIEHVAKLARIALTPEELEQYARELGDILEHAERVQAIATSDIPPTSHPLPMTNAFRDDEVRPSLDRDEVLEMAPDPVGEYFRVPRILGDRPDDAT